ncbi:MAG: LptE family protein [bacterium]
MRRIPIAFFLLPVAMVALLSAGCTRVPRSRTLPLWIQSVYVPMFANDSYEPGIEELLTNTLTDEILADGRLVVESSDKADAILEGKITDFTSTPRNFDREHFATSTDLGATVRLTLYARTRDGKVPLAQFNDVKSWISYLADRRYSRTEMEVDAKARLMEQLSQAIVRELITGNPKNFENAGIAVEGPASAAPAEPYLERRRKDLFIY